MSREPPPDVQALIADADATHERYEREREAGFDVFITSDPLAAWSALARLPEHRGLFLEWGSGMGLITLMAARLGFDAYGIELRRELVQVARALGRRHALDATFVEGSFFPGGFEEDPELLDVDLIHTADGADAYDALGIPLTEFDVIYAFPWPGEEELFLDLFRRGAGAHARLIMNRGRDGISVQS